MIRKKNIISINIKNKVFRDTFYMYCISGMNLILPIIFVPYLSIKIGMDNFGNFAVLAAVYQYALLTIEFGSNTTLSRYLIKNRNLESYFKVAKFRLLLAVFAVGFVYGFQFFILEVKTYISFVIFIFSAFGVAINPISIFQYKNEVPSFAFITFIARILVVLIVLFLLLKYSNIWLAVVFQFLPIFIAAVIGITYIKFKGAEFSFIALVKARTSISDIELKESFSIFIGTLLSSGYTIAIPIIVNHYFGVHATAMYGVIDRLIQPLKQMLMPLMNVIYPKICSFIVNNEINKFIKIIKIAFFSLFNFLIFLLFIVYFFGGSILKYFLHDMIPFVYIFPIAMNVYFVFVSQALTFLVIMPFGFGRYIKYVYVILSVIFFFFFSMLSKQSDVFNLYIILMALEIIGATLLFFLSLYIFYNHSFDGYKKSR